MVQVFLGLFGHESAYFGLLHGLNAFILLGSAMLRRAVGTDG